MVMTMDNQKCFVLNQFRLNVFENTLTVGLLTAEWRN